jgi:hypothetical protein
MDVFAFLAVSICNSSLSRIRHGHHMSVMLVDLAMMAHQAILDRLVQVCHYLMFPVPHRARMRGRLIYAFFHACMSIFVPVQPLPLEALLESLEDLSNIPNTRGYWKALVSFSRLPLGVGEQRAIMRDLPRLSIRGARALLVPGQSFPIRLPTDRRSLMSTAAALQGRGVIIVEPAALFWLTATSLLDGVGACAGCDWVLASSRPPCEAALRARVLCCKLFSLLRP